MEFISGFLAFLFVFVWGFLQIAPAFFALFVLLDLLAFAFWDGFCWLSKRPRRAAPWFFASKKAAWLWAFAALGLQSMLSN